jgi:hypothetical protein
MRRVKMEVPMSTVNEKISGMFATVKLQLQGLEGRAHTVASAPEKLQEDWLRWLGGLFVGAREWSQKGLGFASQKDVQDLQKDLHSLRGSIESLGAKLDLLIHAQGARPRTGKEKSAD